MPSGSKSKHNPEREAAKLAEQKRRSAALGKLSKADKIFQYDDLTCTTVEKYGYAFTRMVHDAIVSTRNVALKHGSRDAYPADKYILDPDSAPKSSKKNTTVKGASGSKNSGSAPPKKGKLPPKRGAARKNKKVVTKSKPKRAAEEDEKGVVEDEDEIDETPHPTAKITNLDKNGKICLQFIANRIIGEIYYGKPDADSFAEFAELVVKEPPCNDPEDDDDEEEYGPPIYESSMVMVAAPAVMRLGSTVHKVKSHKLDTYLKGIVGRLFDMDEDSPISEAVAGYTVKLVCDYFKLMANIIAQQLWQSNKPFGIKKHHLETAMRLLDVGSVEFLHDKEWDQECDTTGINSGILEHMDEYQEACNPTAPKKTDEEKLDGKNKKVNDLEAKVREAKNKVESPDDDDDADALQGVLDDLQEKLEKAITTRDKFVDSMKKRAEKAAATSAKKKVKVTKKKTESKSKAPRKSKKSPKKSHKEEKKQDSDEEVIDDDEEEFDDDEEYEEEVEEVVYDDEEDSSESDEPPAKNKNKNKNVRRARR